MMRNEFEYTSGDEETYSKESPTDVNQKHGYIRV
mgnify:CR=1 FL=1